MEKLVLQYKDELDFVRKQRDQLAQVVYDNNIILKTIEGFYNEFDLQALNSHQS